MTSSHQLPMPLATFLEALERGCHISFYSCDWSSVVGELSNCEGTEFHREACATRWVTHGAKIREQTQDDRLLVGVLRKWLPPYRGDGLTLYRGESADRAGRQQYGLCWTPNVEVATMFASGLNAVRPDGGVLLRAYAPGNSIIPAQDGTAIICRKPSTQLILRVSRVWRSWLDSLPLIVGPLRHRKLKR